MAACVSEENVIVQARYFTPPLPEEVSMNAIERGHFIGQDILTIWGQPDEVVTEFPVFRAQGKVNPQDLLDVMAVAAACAAYLRPKILRGFSSDQWKGTLTKDVHHQRVYEFLQTRSTQHELSVWENWNMRKKDHDVRDAIALELFASGRVKRGGEWR